jgi:UMF1 family MFS transporter
MYDWANSAYSTLSITIVFQYLTTVVFPPESIWGPTVYAWGIALSMFTAALLSPILGALADARANKRKWLAFTSLCGAGAAVVMALAPPELPWLVTILFVTVGLMFELSLGFYNGFLPEIADQHRINRVSAWGYALGYLGGALALVLAICVTLFGNRFGLPELSGQLRGGILIMGLWWGLFTLPTLWVLRDRGQPRQQGLPVAAAVGVAISEVGHTLGNVRRYRMLALFLLGFLLYNDGVQTVISQASTFATKTPEIHFDTRELILLVLMVQVLALPGALLVGVLADRIGQKPTLMICLAVWVGLLVVAYFVNSQAQFWALGVVLAMVLGGTQSVSRAIMGTMTPPSRTAEFFGFFNFSGKATSFLGTFVFGLIYQLTGGNTRPAVISLMVFFLAGWALVAMVDVQKGRQQVLES